MADFTLTPLTDYPQRERVLALAKEHAAAVDADERSPFETLRELAADGGLLTLGREGSLVPQIAVSFDLATECASTAFSLWAHRSTVAFFDAVGRELPEGLASGEVTGATAMAGAFKDASGVGEIQVHAKHVEGGLELNGIIPWTSNLYPGGVVVLPVVVDDAAAGESNKYIVTLRVGVEGHEIKYQKGLMALDSTESGFSKFENVFVPQEDILTDDVPGFLAKVTAPFLTVQSSFCLGLGAAALNSAAQHLDADNGIFREDFERIKAEYERLRTEILELAEDPKTADRTRLLQLRLDVALFANAATHLELSTVGGKAYAVKSPSGRRVREAQFLPVQSPTEGHLRYELSKLK